jgi:hypothetical protein
VGESAHASPPRGCLQADLGAVSTRGRSTPSPRWRCSALPQASVQAKNEELPQRWGQVLGTGFGSLQRTLGGCVSKKKAICWPFVKPSDGLEPSTPSLPWRFWGVTRVHARSLATHFLLQIALVLTPKMRREASRVSFLMCPFCVRALMSISTTDSVLDACAGSLLAGDADESTASRSERVRMQRRKGPCRLLRFRGPEYPYG